MLLDEIEIEMINYAHSTVAAGIGDGTSVLNSSGRFHTTSVIVLIFFSHGRVCAFNSVTGTYSAIMLDKQGDNIFKQN